MNIADIALVNILFGFLLKFLVEKNINNDAQVSSKIILSPARFYGYIPLYSILAFTFVFCSTLYICNIEIVTAIALDTSVITLISFLCLRYITRALNARLIHDFIVRSCFLLIASFAVIATLGIIAIVLIKSVQFFKLIPMHKFLMGYEWFPEDATEDSFGILKLFQGTMYMVLLTMLFAVPLSVLSSARIYFFSRHPKIIKSIFDTMSSVPSIVYGFIAIVIISPFVTDIAKFFEIDAESENTISAVIAITLMILPFLISMSIEVFKNFPKTFIDASLGLGLSNQETVRTIVVPAVMPNLLAIYIIAITRIIGETMIVTMSLGMNAAFSANPLKSVTTFTVQIVAAVTGDNDFASPVFLSAFAISIVLICFTSILNYISILIVRKFGHKYAL